MSSFMQHFLKKTSENKHVLFIIIKVKIVQYIDEISLDVSHSCFGNKNELIMSILWGNNLHKARRPRYQCE